MKKYEYAITNHTADEILATISDLSAEAERLWCIVTPGARAFLTMPLTLTRQLSWRSSTRRGNRVGFWFRSRCASRI